MLTVPCSNRWQLKMHFCPLQTKYHAVIVKIMTLKNSGGGKEEARSRRKGSFPYNCTFNGLVCFHRYYLFIILIHFYDL